MLKYRILMTLATAEGNGSGVKSANISTAQLGAMFSKSSQPASTTAGAPAGAADAKGGTKPGETVSAQSEPVPARRKTGDSQTVSEPTGENASEATEENTEVAPEGDEPNADGAAALAEGDEPAGEVATGEVAETQDNTEAAEPAKAGLPAELAAAIAEAKAAGNKGTADLLKRVHKVVDQRDGERMGRLQAERQVEQLTAQVAELQTAGGKGGGKAEASHTGNPVADHPAVRQVVGQIREVDQYIAWAEENSEGGELPDPTTGKGVFMDAAKVAQMRRNGERLRQELVAQKVQAQQTVQANHEQAYQQFHAQAVKAYPELAKKDSPQSVEARQFLQAMPQLKSFPDYELVIGDYIRGRTARMNAAKTQASAPRKVAAREPARVVAEAPGAVTTGGGDNEGEAKKSRKQFEKSGRMTDLAKSFAAQRRATASR